MMSIGVLGFVVWSWVLASPLSDMGSYVIYFAICWNGLVLIGTLKNSSKNSISYTQSAGNLSLCSRPRTLPLLLPTLRGAKAKAKGRTPESKTQSASETIRETSFNFSAFRQYYNTLFGNDAQHLEFSNNWLTGFIGFAEGDGARVLKMAVI